MFPPNAPVAERLGAHISRPGAVIILDRLRDHLHERGVRATLSYTDRVPRLHVLNILTIWADETGDTLYWGAPNACEDDKPEEGPAKDPGGAPDGALKRIADRVAELLPPS